VTVESATIEMLGGDDVPRRRPRDPKRKRTVREETEALFTEIEATLRRTLAGERDERTLAAAPVIKTPERLAQTVATLDTMASTSRDLQQRVAQLKRELQAYEAALIAEDDADWEWFL